MLTPLPFIRVSIAMALLLTAGSSAVNAQTLAYVRRQTPLRQPNATVTPTQTSLRQLLTQLELSLIHI